MRRCTFLVQWPFFCNSFFYSGGMMIMYDMHVLVHFLTFLISAQWPELLIFVFFYVHNYYIIMYYTCILWHLILIKQFYKRDNWECQALYVGEWQRAHGQNLLTTCVQQWCVAERLHMCMHRACKITERFRHSHGIVKRQEKQFYRGLSGYV